MAMADATKEGPEEKKYLVLDRTGANIPTAFVGQNRLKDKNGGVGGDTIELTVTKIQAAHEEGGLLCRRGIIRVRSMKLSVMEKRAMH